MVAAWPRLPSHVLPWGAVSPYAVLRQPARPSRAVLGCCVTLRPSRAVLGCCVTLRCTASARAAPGACCTGAVATARCTAAVGCRGASLTSDCCCDAADYPLRGALGAALPPARRLGAWRGSRSLRARPNSAAKAWEGLPPSGAGFAAAIRRSMGRFGGRWPGTRVRLLQIRRMATQCLGRPALSLARSPPPRFASVSALRNQLMGCWFAMRALPPPRRPNGQIWPSRPRLVTALSGRALGALLGGGPRSGKDP